MMTTTRAIANAMGAAAISDHSCATPSNHSNMVVFPQSGASGGTYGQKVTFLANPNGEPAMPLENDFTPWRLSEARLRIDKANGLKKTRATHARRAWRPCGCARARSCVDERRPVPGDGRC